MVEARTIGGGRVLGEKGEWSGCASVWQARGRTRAGVTHIRSVSAPTQIRPKFKPEMSRGRTKLGRSSICIGTIMTACVIMRNMIVENERGQDRLHLVSLDGRTRYADEKRRANQTLHEGVE